MGDIKKWSILVMGLFGDLFFSSEAYKMAMDINEHLKQVYRIMAPSGNIITPSNARIVKPEVTIVVEKLNELEWKVNKCSPSRVRYIKVPTLDGYEIPIVVYVSQLRRGVELMQSDLRECL